MEILITIVVVLLLIGMLSAFHEPNYKSEEINQKVVKENSLNNMLKSGDMKVKIDQIIERYNLDVETADLVKSEIETFADWLKEYGPMTWYSGESDVPSVLRSNLVWTRGPFDSDVQSVANGFDADDYPEILSEGYFVAIKPCNEEPYSVYVSTDIYLSCNNCSDSENDPGDCHICKGDGYFWFDIVELFDEITVAKNQH